MCLCRCTGLWYIMRDLAELHVSICLISWSFIWCLSLLVLVLRHQMHFILKQHLRWSFLKCGFKSLPFACIILRFSPWSLRWFLSYLALMLSKGQKNRLQGWIFPERCLHIITKKLLIPEGFKTALKTSLKFSKTKVKNYIFSPNLFIHWFFNPLQREISFFNYLLVSIGLWTEIKVSNIKQNYKNFLIQLSCDILKYSYGQFRTIHFLER